MMVLAVLVVGMVAMALWLDWRLRRGLAALDARLDRLGSLASQGVEAHEDAADRCERAVEDALGGESCQMGESSSAYAREFSAN